MLVPKFAALLCSGALVVSALKLPVPGYGGDSVVESMYDSGHAQQNSLDASKLLRGAQEFFDDTLEIETAPVSFKTAENRTIYQILSDSNNFSRLVKIINISDEIVSLLNSTAAGITFFAPTNKALHLPRHRKHHHGHLATLASGDPAATLSSAYSSYELSEILSEIEELEVSRDDEPDKEHRKKIIKIIVRAILAYHILPQGLDAAQLARNTTYATNLTVSDGALDREALRIRVATSKLLPAIKINFLATIIKSDIGATNGIIHVVNHPLLPPPSIFQELFFFPRFFGAVTSALQRVGLTDALEWRYLPKGGKDDKKWTVEGTGSTTFFVPSNIAFKKLPKKLQLFLFSPFGEKVLKKLLEFHIVPGIVLHSDYLHNTTSGESLTLDFSADSSTAMDFDLSEAILFADGADKVDCFGILCHQGRPALPGHRRHGEPYEPENRDHDDFKRRHPLPPPPRSGREPQRAPHGFHPPPPPPPLPGFRGPHDIGGRLRGQGDCPSFHKPFPRPPPVFAANLTLPTLLTNHSLHVHVAKFKYRLPIPGHPKDIYVSKLFVNHQRVIFADVVARNGAAHIIDNVINPHRHHRHRPHKPEVVESSEKGYEERDEEDWEDWEDWLPQWAAEN